MEFLRKVANKYEVRWTLETLKLFQQDMLERKILEIINNKSHKDLLNNKNKFGFPIINGFLYKLNELLDDLFAKYNYLKEREEYFIYCVLKKNYKMKKNKKGIFYISGYESIYEVFYGYNYTKYWDYKEFDNIRKYDEERDKGYTFHSLNEDEFSELIKVLYYCKKKEIRKKWRIAIYKVLLALKYTNNFRFKIDSKFYDFKWKGNISCAKNIILKYKKN
jgi:hypothetical protein